MFISTLGFTLLYDAWRELFRFPQALQFSDLLPFLHKNTTEQFSPFCGLIRRFFYSISRITFLTCNTASGETDNSSMPILTNSSVREVSAPSSQIFFYAMTAMSADGTFWQTGSPDPAPP